MLLAPFAGTFVWLQYQKKLIKKEVKTKLIADMDLRLLSVIKVNKEDAKQQLKWEHQHEFEYKGQMYDVVKIEYEGDHIIYWCWHDQKESKLNKKLVQLIAQAVNHNPQNKKQQQQLIDFLKTFFKTQSNLDKNGLTDIAPTWNIENIFPHHQLSKSPPVPPPKCV